MRKIELIVISFHLRLECLSLVAVQFVICDKLVIRHKLNYYDIFYDILRRPATALH